MEFLHLTDYQVFPSVVPVGQEVTVTIVPRGNNCAFPEEYEYRVGVFGTATANRVLNKCQSVEFVCHPKNGSLSFTTTFEREQQYVIKITMPEPLRYCSNPYYQPPAHGLVPRPSDIAKPVLYLYALETDLYRLRPYKGDFHLHSSDSDGHESSCGTLANLRRAGYDFAALTNHYWFHSFEKVRKQWTGVEDVMTLFPAEEIHTPTEFLHAVGVGHRESINDLYYGHREECDNEISEIEKSLTDLPSSIDKRNYASRLWVARKMKELGGMSILVHPHWIWNEVYFMPEDLTIHLLESGEYDAFELLNGDSGPETNRLQTSLYFEERSKGFNIPIVGSSDCHRTDREDEKFPATAFSLVFSEDLSFPHVKEAILDGRCVAVEKYREDKQFRLYGSYRLVKYANFLMLNYFPVYTELCAPQGTLLREYETEPGKEQADLIHALYQKSESFFKKFFGRR